MGFADSRIDFGRRVLIRRGRAVSGRVGIRSVLVCSMLLVVALVVAVISLGTGDFDVPPLKVVETILGGGTPADHLAIVEWRMPRVLAALGVGAALGASGALFQSLTRNPLGSPDIIGFNVGAYTGALVVMVVSGAGYAWAAAGSVVGGLLTALAVYLLAYRRGVQGFRLIIVGIALTAMLQSVNTWLIYRTDLGDSMLAAAWGAGTLNGVKWPLAVPLLVALAVLAVPTIVVARRMHILDLGDDAAQALGLRTERVRLAMIVVGVALSAVAVALAGPIAFVALAAPQLASRLARTAGVSVVPAAAMGALLLVLSDFIAQNAFAPTQLPVGVVTVSIGGVYLVWLLAVQARRQ
nr:iron chelate uptake ABC transporter family permease subunit [Gordonia humi]